ncbi:MAG: [citrate (pro-3S)-lyase] ligase [Treponema sp.]|nr:[citrate (pro-3S)-lyase] ligase [Treponema sp.]
MAHIAEISKDDDISMKEVEDFLIAEGIRKDSNLDYTCAMYDDNSNIIATGSCFANTLRCLAVSSNHRGEGLMNELVSHLIQIQIERGNVHLFLYTKCESSEYFQTLGFYEVARIDKQIVFMENKKTGFADYLKKLANADTESHENKKIAAIVMNANPFTLGHQYLVERAAAENDIVHLFIVSEDCSLVPFSIRKKLVLEGTSHLSNVRYHDSGPYIISSATFPSYFQKDSNAVIESHAALDIAIFTKIAKTLGIQRRYVGEEPASLVTGIYNDIMKEKLPEHGIDCIILPRKTIDEEVVSASTVRKVIHEGAFTKLKKLVPETTYKYFISGAAASVIEKIQYERNVVHY